MSSVPQPLPRPERPLGQGDQLDHIERLAVLIRPWLLGVERQDRLWLQGAQERDRRRVHWELQC